MSWKFALAITAAIIAAIIVRMCTRSYTLPEISTTKYWGPSDKSTVPDNTAIRRFKIIYEPDIINDLRRILERPLKLQDPLEGVGFRYGFNSRQMRPLVDYWRGIYLGKWKTRQEYLNQFEHYMTQINGLHVHFIHAKPLEFPPADDYIRIPILLLHGWPGSVREFYDLIPKLTSYDDDHSFAFEVVAPSLVGYGFSSAAAKKGFATYEMAIIMRNLMLRLGYNRFVVQGGDWGSVIGSQLTTLFPENVIAYHSNMCLVPRTTISFAKSVIASFYPTLFVKEEHIDFHFPLKEKLAVLIEETGYFHLQATKPDTIGIALATSPVGLAAYILEKFSTGTDINNRELDDGGLDNRTLDMDALLDNIMIYYLTNTITSSMRFYAESTSPAQLKIPFDRIPSYVPMACIRFKNDLLPAFDWQLRDKFPNLVQSTYIDHGGHFAAMELPDVLYNDIVQFVKKVTSRK